MEPSGIAWRPCTTEHDLSAGLCLRLAHFGGEIAGEEAARRAWSGLLHQPGFVSAVFEAGSRIVGFGAAVFISPKFADAEIANPRPGINSRFIAAMADGRPPVLGTDDLARGNSGPGLDILILYGGWPPGPWDEELRVVMPATFLQLLRGYRLKRILREPVGDHEIEPDRASETWEEIAAFPECGRVLNLMTAESAGRLVGSMAVYLFRYREPVLQFAAREQQLLAAALGGATDAEIAEILSLTLASVKARWRSILVKVNTGIPELMVGNPSAATRGPQNRHRVLQYMREHPEELRPYRRPSLRQRSFR